MTHLMLGGTSILLPSIENQVISKGEKAIWYHPEREIWLVGHISEHGGNKGAFYASDNFGGLTDCKNQWFYWHKNGWKKAGISNGLDIKCTIAGKNCFVYTY